MAGVVAQGHTHVDGQAAAVCIAAGLSTSLAYLLIMATPADKSYTHTCAPAGNAWLNVICCTLCCAALNGAACYKQCRKRQLAQGNGLHHSLWPTPCCRLLSHVFLDPYHVRVLSITVPAYIRIASSRPGAWSLPKHAACPTVTSCLCAC